MKKYMAVFTVICLMFALGLRGCSKKAESSSNAIEKSKSMKTTEEQINYLIGQANAFYNSKDFQNA
ncbi:MAG: hypothetical protein PHW62_04280, partial [Candidatus Ratteibacteria bacterium]|nr:hypothetical protein [Candidatus Ratteibacteria bacterium]